MASPTLARRRTATIDTTTPTGHTYRSQAPPVLTIRDYPARPDYVLAG